MSIKERRFLLPAVMSLLVFLSVGAWDSVKADDGDVSFTKEKSKKAFIGIVPRKLDHVMRAALDFEEPGILLAEIVRETAAEDAGLEVGDILSTFDGTPLHDPDRLTRVMKKYRAGDEVSIVYYRAGKKKSMKLVLGHRPEKVHIFGENLPMHFGDEHAFAWTSAEGLEGIEGLKGLEALEALECLEDIEINLPEMLSGENGEIQIFIDDDSESHFD